MTLPLLFPDLGSSDIGNSDTYHYIYSINPDILYLVVEGAVHVSYNGSDGSTTFTGDISANNLSGINTGDQPLIAGTNQGQMAFWDSTQNKWTYTETSELFWNDTTKTVESYNLLIKGTLQNYNPDLMDMGSQQINNVVGYGDAYVAEKVLSYCRIGGSAKDECGAIRVINETFQIYINGNWEDVVTNFRFREDVNGGYELEHKPVGFNLWIEVSNGNSNKLGNNGLPITQNYVTSMGAYPVPIQLYGGVF